MLFGKTTQTVHIWKYLVLLLQIFFNKWQPKVLPIRFSSVHVLSRQISCYLSIYFWSLFVFLSETIFFDLTQNQFGALAGMGRTKSLNIILSRQWKCISHAEQTIVQHSIINVQLPAFFSSASHSWSCCLNLAPSLLLPWIHEMPKSFFSLLFLLFAW